MAPCRETLDTLLSPRLQLAGASESPRALRICPSYAGHLLINTAREQFSNSYELAV